MKKKQKGLSLEKFNVARLTKSIRYIYGGGTTEPTDICPEGITDRCQPEPPSNSSIECCASPDISHDCATRLTQQN